MYADYKNGITNLACSILKYYGAEYSHDTLATMDSLLEHSYKNVVVMLFDGMGMDALNYHLPQSSFLRRHLVTEYSSVFPPTTTAATISLESGLTPAEHGWMGWSLYFSEIDKIVNIFTNKDKYTKEEAANYHVAWRYLPYKSIYEKIADTGKAKAYSVSKFGSNKVITLEELFREITGLCSQEGKKYIYSYWEDPDKTMHDVGCYEETVTNIIKEIDHKVEEMCQELEDTLVIVTADHGHCNLTHYELSDYPYLVNMLQRPISIETRAAAFYVKEEFLLEFPDRFHELFGNDFFLFSKEQIKEQKIFGDGTPHPKFDTFIGDYLAVAIADKGIVYDHNSARHQSNHAGMNEKEMLIPFIAIEKK